MIGSNRDAKGKESPRGFALLKPYFDNKSKGKATFTTKLETSNQASLQEQSENRRSDQLAFSEQEESKDEVQMKVEDVDEDQDEEESRESESQHLSDSDDSVSLQSKDKKT
jgi:hypothetical protein